jgi:hypothetical protein
MIFVTSPLTPLLKERGKNIAVSFGEGWVRL